MGSQSPSGEDDATVNVGSGSDQASASESASGSTKREPGATGPDNTRILPRGVEIGPYIIIEPVGRGGMGVVYAAFDPRLDRRIALKVVRPRRDSDPEKVTAERLRLVREARAMASLPHPNVASIFDAGEIDGQVYIAMELILGSTLRSWQDGDRPWAAVLDVYLQAGRGLAAAHATGIIHRDFKPGNAMIDESGRVRVLDFGLAAPPRAPGGTPDSAIFDDAPWLHTVTDPRVVLGTPAYMPPEQAMGNELDGRSDQFSFFVSLYQGLHGCRPFAGRGVGLLEEIEAGRQQRGPRSDQVPGWLDRVVKRGLAYEPGDRWPSMSVALTRLQRRRVPRAAWTVAVLGATLAVAFALARDRDSCASEAEKLGPAWGDARRRDVSDAFRATELPYAETALSRVSARLDSQAAQWVEARTELCRLGATDPEFDLAQACLDRSRDAFDALTRALARADGQTVENSVGAVLDLQPPSGCLDPGRAAGQATMPQDPALRGRVRRVQAVFFDADAASIAGRYADALALEEGALRQAQDIGYPPLVAKALLRVGVAAGRDGQRERQVEATSESYWAAMAAGDHELAADAAGRLAYAVGNEQARSEEGLQWVRHARAALTHVESPQRLLGDLENAIGSIHLARGEPEVALEHLERALALRLELYEPNHRMVASSRSNLGLVLTRLGRFEDSLKQGRKAIEIRVAIYGEDHPHVATAHHNVAYTLGQAGRYAEGKPHHQEALRIREAALGPRHERLASSLNGLGIASLHLGEYERAAQLLTRAAAIWRRDGGPPHPRLPMAVFNLGTVRLDQGRPGEALAHMQEALELTESKRGADHPDLVYPLEGLMRAHLAEDRPERAAQLGERALEVLGDKQHTNRGEVLWRLAQANWALGRHARARHYAEQARGFQESRPEPDADEIAELDAWLRAHPLPLGAERIGDGTDHGANQATGPDAEAPSP